MSRCRLRLPFLLPSCAASVSCSRPKRSTTAFHTFIRQTPMPVMKQCYHVFYYLWIPSGICPETLFYYVTALGALRSGPGTVGCNTCHQITGLYIICLWNMCIPARGSVSLNCRCRQLCASDPCSLLQCACSPRTRNATLLSCTGAFRRYVLL